MGTSDGSSRKVFQRSCVLAALRSGAETVGAIARESEGLYPADLLDLLDNLVREGKVVTTDRGYALAPTVAGEPAPQISLRPSAPAVESLPEPHPLDYDWRYTSKTSASLARRLATYADTKGRVLLIGAPTVFVDLARMPNPPVTTLVDWNQSLVESLTTTTLRPALTLTYHDLLSGVLWSAEKPFQVMLCDPPWYPEYFRAFLAHAAVTADIGATVMLSLLPLNTRPHAAPDRWDVLSTARELGLHVQSIEARSVRYETPAFERRSLLVLSRQVDNDWRAGDLVLFRKLEETDLATVQRLLADAAAQPGDGNWHEILLGRYKVKLRGPFDDHTADPEVQPVEQGDVLPTVSRRYPGRSRVGLWLWDNRVYGTKGRAAIWAGLHILAKRPIPSELSTVPDHASSRAVRLLQPLLESGGT